MANYTYSKISRRTHPPYDLQVVESSDAYGLVDYKSDIEEIHVTVPPADDVRSGQYWSYPHITFVDASGNRDHLYIVKGAKGHYAATSRGKRIVLSASEWLLFRRIVEDMSALYGHI
ncbi:MAG: hypothetical protein H6811_04875 [Phycisphaeraceae bacterium]|nr:hypothetical protein [Phycisphaeraceae bacterium]